MNSHVDNEIFSLQRREKELSDSSHRTLENIQIEIKNIINMTMNTNNINKIINALQEVELLSSNCNNDIRKYQDVCRELINVEKEKSQAEVELIKQQQNDTDNSLERQILTDYINNRKVNRKSYWKSFQYLTNSESMFVNKSPRNITAAELLVTNIDSFQKQELKMQDQLQKALNEVEKIKSDKESLANTVGDITTKLEALLIEKEDAEEKAKEVKLQLEKFQKTYDDKLIEVKQLENQLQNEKTQCESLKQQNDKLTQQIDDQHDVVVSNLNEQVRELTDQCQQFEKEKRKIKLDYELSIQNYNSLVEKTDKDIASKNKELSSLTSQLKKETELVEKLNSDNKKVVTELEEQRNMLEEYKAMKEDYEKANNDISKLNVEHLETQKENERLREAILKKNDNITSLKSYANEMTEKIESLETKLKEVLEKWNDERSKLIAKSSALNRRISMNNISAGTGDISAGEANTNTVYYNDKDQLMIKEVNLIDSFESSEAKKEMLNEIEKYKEEIKTSKNLLQETDAKYKDCLKKLEKSEESLHNMEENETKLKNKINHVKSVYSSMVEAIQTESRIKIDILSDKLDYTNECLNDTKKRNEELQANLKDNISDEMNKLLSQKEEEIENLRRELQQSVSESNRNDFMERENQLKEKIRELEAVLSSNELSYNKQSEEMNVLNQRNIELEQMITETKIVLKAKEEEEEDKMNRIETLEQSLQQTKKILEEKESQISQNNDEFTNMKNQCQRFNDKNNELSGKLEESTQIINHLTEENKNCQLEILKKEEKIKDLQEKLLTNQKTASPTESINMVDEPDTSFTSLDPEAQLDGIKKIAMVNRELSRKLSHANHEEIVQSLSNQVFKLYNEMNEVENEKASLTEEYEELQKQKSENEAVFNKRLNEINNELKSNKDLLSRVQKKFESIEKDNTRFKVENESLKRELERCQLKLENTNKKMLTMMENHEEEIRQKDEKYNELLSLNEQLREKYSRFINLLKQKNVL